MYNYGFSGLAAIAVYAETLRELQTPQSLKYIKEKSSTNIVHFIVEWRGVLAAFDCGMWRRAVL